jgi:gamma-glutamyl-gamma-aminobutyrate hydrolase PuuD
VKRIGITQRLIRDPRHGEIRDALDVRWSELLRELGALAVPIPSHGDAIAFASALQLDGLIFSGGNDLSALSEDPLAKLRDACELPLLRYALANRLPVLAVCRGMQLVVHALGGALAQTAGHAGTRHALEVSADAAPGSYSEMLAPLREVNSFHDWAVVAAGPELRVCARAPDGTIEAVEHPGHRLFGQMWHPEREAPFSAIDRAIAKRALW